VEQLLIVRPGVPAEERDRGILLARLGRAEEATRVLEDFLQGEPGDPDVERVGRILERLRRRGPSEAGDNTRHEEGGG
jgi:regulator of sirC expression with transglutaminase-like and TPR domain